MKFLNNSILAFVAVAVLGCATLQKGAVYIGEVTENETLVKAAGDMTPQQEYFLGRGIAAQVLTGKKVVEKKNVLAYVNFIGQYLALHSDRPDLYVGYRFAVVEDASPSALSAPGGYVFVSTGMLNLAKNEDEIAAVLAHEVAHISQKHAEKNIRNSNQLSLGKSLIANIAQNPDNNDLKSFTDAIAGGLDTAYNKDQESEADEEAIRILKKSGYSPAALKEILLRMPANSEHFSKHPRTTERIQKITEWCGGAKFVESEARKKRFENNSK